MGCRVVGRGSRASKVGVRVINARVDDADLDPLAAKVGRRVPDRRSTDVRDACHIVGHVVVHRQQSDHSGYRSELVQLRRWYLDLDPVQRRLELGEDFSTRRLNLRFDRVLVALELVFDLVLLSTDQLSARVGLGLSYRLVLELDNDNRVRTDTARNK